MLIVANASRFKSHLSSSQSLIPSITRWFISDAWGFNNVMPGNTGCINVGKPSVAVPDAGSWNRVNSGVPQSSALVQRNANTTRLGFVCAAQDQALVLECFPGSNLPCQLERPHIY